MSEIYERLLDVSGKGHRLKQQQGFAQAIALGEPYSKFCSTIQASFSSAVAQHHEALLARVKGLFESLVSEFETVYNGREKDVTDPDELQFMDEVRQYVGHAKQALAGHIAAKFARSALPPSDRGVRVKRERSA